jgi:hypothetical protein
MRLGEITGKSESQITDLLKHIPYGPTSRTALCSIGVDDSEKSRFNVKDRPSTASLHIHKNKKGEVTRITMDPPFYKVTLEKDFRPYPRYGKPLIPHGILPHKTYIKGGDNEGTGHDVRDHSFGIHYDGSQE